MIMMMKVNSKVSWFISSKILIQKISCLSFCRMIKEQTRTTNAGMKEMRVVHQVQLILMVLMPKRIIHQL